MTFTHDSVCACPFCVLEKPRLQLCGVLLRIEGVGVEFGYPKKHAEHAIPEISKALAQLFTALREGGNGQKSRLTATKRGQSETFDFKSSTLSLECVVDKKAWKLCFHTKVFEDEDPN